MKNIPRKEHFSPLFPGFSRDRGVGEFISWSWGRRNSQFAIGTVQVGKKNLGSFNSQQKLLHSTARDIHYNRSLPTFSWKNPREKWILGQVFQGISGIFSVVPVFYSKGGFPAPFPAPSLPFSCSSAAPGIPGDPSAIPRSSRAGPAELFHVFFPGFSWIPPPSLPPGRDSDSFPSCRSLRSLRAFPNPTPTPRVSPSDSSCRDHPSGYFIPYVHPSLIPGFWSPLDLGRILDPSWFSCPAPGTSQIFPFWEGRLWSRESSPGSGKSRDFWDQLLFPPIHGNSL